MKRINVVGTSGSGKSTFARKLSTQISYPYIEMDALFWGKNWQQNSDEVFFYALEQALQQECWVLDGNYTRANHIKWDKIDTVIWIDFSFLRTLYQATKRALTRIITQKELWSGTGNRETLGRLFSSDSILWWTIKTYWEKKSRYEQMMQSPDYNHIQFVRLQSPRACEVFLREFNVR